MDTQSIKDKIRKYLAEFVQYHELRDDEDIFALGFVNSLFAMQLVEFMEREFGLRVENQDLELDNFRTINAMAGFVESKLGG